MTPAQVDLPYSAHLIPTGRTATLSFMFSQQITVLKPRIVLKVLNQFFNSIYLVNRLQREIYRLGTNAMTSIKKSTQYTASLNNSFT